MSNDFADELGTLAERLKSAAQVGRQGEIADPLERLHKAALSVAGAWSGSALGYHARVPAPSWPTLPIEPAHT